MNIKLDKEMRTIKIKTAGQLLTARPKSMSYEAYKDARREQNKWLRGYNEASVIGGVIRKRHIPGRLEGVLIPSNEYRNSQDPRIVIVR